MNLVIQGVGMDAAVAAQAAALSRADSSEQVGEFAWRLRSAALPDEVALFCESRSLDCAWVPEGRRFADLGLLAMDMDSTLITIECIDEIGGMLGIKDRIAAITASAMRGEIDYPESLRRRVKLLAGLDEAALLRVYEEKLALSPGAEQLIAGCKRHGIKLLLVSGGFTFFTDRLKARLSIDYTISNVLGIANGKLTGELVGRIVDAGVKAERFRKITAELGAHREQTVAIGDGANDLLMMAEAGVSVAYHAKPVVRAQATCALTYSGLDGVLNLFE